jgi:diguanylate cyclase (GGDEF)-like protein
LSTVRLLVDGALDAAAVVDRDLNVVHYNASYMRLTEIRPGRFRRVLAPGMCHHIFGLQSCEDGCASTRAMEAGKPLRLDEVKAVLRLGEGGEALTEAEMERRTPLRLLVAAIPLMTDDGRVCGAIEQYRDVTAENKMQEEYRRMLEQERAQRAALAEELVQTTARSKEAIEKERRLAYTDGLTGVNNRRYFDSRLGELINTALNGGPSVSLILFDLDHFKRVNDTYGHAKGDETLCEFARILRSAARENDVVARFGGEEFAMLIQGSSPAAAKAVSNRVLERVREAVSAKTLVTTTSGGIATCPLDVSTAEDLVRTADRALYAAKHGGRNQILAVSEIPSTPPSGA